jgi:signal transduction histidine kinase
MQTLRKLLKEFRALEISLSLKFIIGIAVTLTIAMGVSLYFISQKHEKLVFEQLDIQAKALFKQIVLTRKWIADHGGVFVEKFPWKEASPYLKESEIIDVKGRKYIKESPAMVTKELSNYAKKEGLYWFHITSLKLINPENAPDDFEKIALMKFEAEHINEFSKIEKIDSSYYYRYIAPLYIEESCLECHSHQGYKIGDVRGAISVTVPMDYALSMIRSERMGMVLASLATICLLMLILYVMMKELVLRPVKELKTSMKDFTKGEKTGTSVIRTGDELEDLSNSFIEMSESLIRYHTSLENEVQKATNSLEEANTRLTELNEKKSDFIAKISHELRTPMTSIKGAMDYISTRVSKISRTDKDAGDLMEFLDVIKNNADRLVRMVNDTLDIERIESGMFDLHFSEVDLIALIKEVIISFQSITGERNIIFKIVANPKALISADEDRIRQVLINLVSNAINYSPDNAEIQVNVTESDKTVTVTLKDEGPGIPVEVQEKIFDKFYTIGKRYGTGLGLAICRGIIEMHNGEINVLKDIKKGSAIYFTLPKMV